MVRSIPALDRLLFLEREGKVGDRWGHDGGRFGLYSWRGMRGTMSAAEERGE